jgi:hypothetical protein
MGTKVTKTIQVALAVLFVVLCTACTQSMPLQGALKTQKLLIVGKATLATNEEKQTVVFFTARGVSCGGPWYMKTFSEYVGTITCSDGRIGSFSAVMKPLSAGGKGSGTLSDGEKFVFSFGASLAPGEYAAEVEEVSPALKQPAENSPADAGHSI